MTTKDPGTNIITQIGLVVPNIETALDAYCKVFHLPRPDVHLTGPQEQSHTRYRGEPTHARAKLAFFQMGQVSLELIEPIGGPSTWQEYLDKHGPGVHHIAFVIKDTNQVVASLESQGIPLVQQGEYTGGMYSYMDSYKKLGVVLELLENFSSNK